MEVIKQTNRTILFEEFNPQKNNLLVLLSDIANQSNLTDEKILEINNSLLVTDFDCFLERFQPVIYEVFDIRRKEIKYILKKPDNIPDSYIQMISINKENDFLKMILSLLENQKKSNKNQQKFNFEHMIDFISPIERINQFIEKKNYILSLYQKYTKSDKNEISSEELKIRIEEQLHTLLKDSDIMSLLPVVLDNLQRKLIPGQEYKQMTYYDPVTDGILNRKVEKELHILDAPTCHKEDYSQFPEEGLNGLKEIIMQAYKTKNHNCCDYIKELLLYSFGIYEIEENSDNEAKVMLYNKLLEFYKQAKKNFVKVLKPLIEKIIGVKLFFDQYQNQKGGMGVSLLITNVEIGRWSTIENLNRLESYLNTVNTKTNYDNTIWFSIIPNIIFLSEKKNKISRERFRGNDLELETRENNIMPVMNIMKILSNYKILSFFSFETNEDTTFPAVAQKGIQPFIKSSRVFMKKDFSAGAVPCLPNFTIIPKERSNLIIGQKLRVTDENKVAFSFNEEDYLKLWLGGIYIEASYVAAGLTSAYQCPAFLNHCFEKNISEEFPGVHYNIEEKDYCLCTTTTLAKEVPGFKKEILAELNNNKFGFLFLSENEFMGGKKIKNSIVLSARNLLYKNDNFEPIFQEMVITYIERMIRYDTCDYKKEEIIRFFQNNSNNRKNKWVSGRKYINSILDAKDKLEYEIDEENAICTLKISFHEQQKEIGVELYNVKKPLKESENIYGT